MSNYTSDSRAPVREEIHPPCRKEAVEEKCEKEHALFCVIKRQAEDVRNLGFVVLALEERLEPLMRKSAKELVKGGDEDKAKASGDSGDSSVVLDISSNTEGVRTAISRLRTILDHLDV